MAQRPNIRRFITAEILSIRADERPLGAIAEHYGVAKKTISLIKSGKSYKHVEGPPPFIRDPDWNRKISASLVNKRTIADPLLKTIIDEEEHLPNASSNGTCRLFDLKEIPLPPECKEVIAFAKERFTTRQQWGYLRVWIESFAL